MAKPKNEESAAVMAVAPEAADTAIAVAAPAGAIVDMASLTAAVIADAGKGAENIGADNVTLARLSLAQKTSPQLEEGKEQYNPDLRMGHLFNSLTNEGYGKELEIVVLSYLGEHAVEFTPFDQGGGVVDYDVPLDDPRCQWDESTDPATPPVATIFDDFIVFLPATGEVLALSMKTFSRKTAKKLNTIVKSPLKWNGVLLPKPPAFLRKFTLAGAIKQVDATKSVYMFSFKPSGTVDGDTYAQARALHEAYASANVKIDRRGEGARDAAEGDVADGEY